MNVTTYVYISLQREDRISVYVMDPNTGSLARRTEFPLSDEEVVTFREEIAEQVLNISALEEPAVAAMKEAMA